VIIKREPLANFSNGVAYDSINIGVIVRRTAEDIDPDGTFLNLIAMPEKRLLDNIPKR